VQFDCNLPCERFAIDFTKGRRRWLPGVKRSSSRSLCRFYGTADDALDLPVRRRSAGNACYSV
jgi:hypothetical protein